MKWRQTVAWKRPHFLSLPVIDKLPAGGILKGKRGIPTNYTYVLRCADGTLYTGWTNDLERRIAVHNAGKGAKYTRSRLPVELYYAESHETREEALRREYAIKHLSREEKLALPKHNA